MGAVAVVAGAVGVVAVVAVVALLGVAVATISVNIAANVVSPANDFANALPRVIDFRTGGLLTGLIGIAMQPWKLLADPSGYIFTWLVGYSGGKIIRGPQTAGMLLGRKDLVAAAFMNSAPCFATKPLPSRVIGSNSCTVSASPPVMRTTGTVP